MLYLPRTGIICAKSVRLKTGVALKGLNSVFLSLTVQIQSRLCWDGDQKEWLLFLGKFCVLVGWTRGTERRFYHQGTVDCGEEMALEGVRVSVVHTV